MKNTNGKPPVRQKAIHGGKGAPSNCKNHNAEPGKRSGIQRMAQIYGTALAMGALVFASCSYGLDDFFSRRYTTEERITSISASTQLATPSATKTASTVTFAALSDLHFGGTLDRGKGRVEEQFLTWLTEQKEAGTAPAFVLSLGDSADHGFGSEYEDYVAFTDKIDQILNDGNDAYTVYTVVGNHDLYNSGWGKWKEMVYPHISFYHFTTGTAQNNNQLSWYFLDSGSGSLGTNQYYALKDMMEADPLPKIISLHYPVYGDPAHLGGYFALQNYYETTMLLSLFSTERVRLVLDGHAHHYYHQDFGSYDEYNLPSVTASGQWALFTVDATDGSILKFQMIYAER